MDKTLKVEPRTLSGFMELLPQDQILFNRMLKTIGETYESFGFLPLDTPVLELSEVLLAKAGGETEKQIYSFVKGGASLTMRFDLTVPLAKYVAKNFHELAFPFRRYQIGKVYRGEKAQKGRFREFYQCDIDIIGDGELNILNDAEIPSVIYNTFSALGLGDFVIRLNNRKILNGLFEALGASGISKDIMILLDKAEKIGPEKTGEELRALLNDEARARALLDFTGIEGGADSKLEALKNYILRPGAAAAMETPLYRQGVEELEKVITGIRQLGVPEGNFEVDLKIARGLDYYTGTVYETFLRDCAEMGSVCSGGRYDNLAEYYTSRRLPGVGISIGLTRLFAQLKEKQLIREEALTVSPLIILPLTGDLSRPLALARTLREKKLNVEVYLNQKPFKTMLKYADRLKIPWALIIGEDEIARDRYLLKDMSTGNQEELSLEEVVSRFTE